MNSRTIFIIFSFKSPSFLHHHYHHHQSAPNRALEPKVQRAFVVGESEVPRKIEIERQKRFFAAKKVETLLEGAGLNSTELLPGGPFTSTLVSLQEQIEVTAHLPLEYFDDNDNDPRLPEEWLDLATGSEGVPARVLCVQQSRVFWADAGVTAYAADTQLYDVTKVDDGAALKLPRLFVMFLAEDPDAFIKRVKNAYVLRRETEEALRQHIIADCMPSDEQCSLSDESLQRVTSLLNGLDKRFVWINAWVI